MKTGTTGWVAVGEKRGRTTFGGVARGACGISLALGLVAVPGCALETDEPIASLGQQLSARSPTDRSALALRWAPIHYQDVDQTGRHALGGASDFIARYDFDGDLDARNNWENTGDGAHPLRAHAYYSVVETSTHWYIIYLFFHPRDWSDSFFETEHENDAEGVLLTVARDGSQFGSLRAAVTVAHQDFYSYTPASSSWGSGRENVDGSLTMQSHLGQDHPVTAQEAKGHGMKAWPAYDIAGGDGVIYYPSLTTAEVPSHANDRHVLYRLVDIFETGGLLDQRENPSLSAAWGAFAGNRSGGCGAGTIGCTENAANAPWGWDDHDDRPGRGALANDPAGLVDDYFSIPEAFSREYTFNPYLLPLTDGGVYELRVSHSQNHCADVAGASSADGANVLLWSCHGGSNQKWWAVELGGGEFALVSDASGKCLDQIPGSRDGLNVIQYECHFGANQRWRPVPAGGGVYHLVNRNSGRVLEVSGHQSTRNGANIQTWTNDGSGDMKWTLRRL